RRNAATVGRKPLAIDVAERIALLEHGLNEALEQQSATTEILRVIASAPTEIQSVLDAITTTAARLLDVADAYIMRVEGQLLRAVSTHGPSPQWAIGTTRAINREWVTGRAVVDRKPVHVRDLQTAQREFPEGAAYAKQYGHRTTLATPLLREGKPIGAFLIRRNVVKPFTNKQIELLQNFAAQAVIAIENTRLLNELRQRTDDLTESLEQQTATSEVLKVISSSAGRELEPVFDTMLRNATRLCGAEFSLLYLSEGDVFRTVSLYGVPPAFAEQRRLNPVLHPSPGTALGRVLATKQMAYIPDVMAEPAYQNDPLRRATFLNLAGARTVVCVPMLKDNEVVGAISIYRQEVRSFTEKQIELLENFAAQAVIAIENTRLLNELRQRTNDLSEALEQQTATSEVLKVISSSPTNVQPVFDSIAENAVRLCDGQFSFVVRFDGKAMEFASCWGLSTEGLATFQSILPMPASEDTAAGRAILRRAVVEIPDVWADCSYGARSQGLAKAVIYRSIAAVPLLQESNPIGAIAVARANAGSFPKRQIALLQAFADQAVIAIENVRLFDEVQARTRELSESLQQQTATADVLKVISRSTFDLRAVLDTLVKSAVRICRAEKGNVALLRDDTIEYIAQDGFPPDFLEYMKALHLKVQRGSVSGRAALEGKIVHVPDVLADPEFVLLDAQKVGGFRTALGVPLMREGIPIGTMFLARAMVEPFTQQQIDLVSTFADQAVIAIENVRLFQSVEARTRELAASLENLRTTQDRLVQTQKLASLGQLTAGIAHEIKNPLNFVNNFSGISAELLTELQEALADVSLNEKRHNEITELMQTLRGNLDKVVQHGKRADAIVKNMLLHSREGSGEHRVVDINALVEESLNLAYHGARAEKQGFNITMERSLDPAAGEADVFPQDITRVLLNLISNGSYAATRRTAQADGDAYEPTLVASTRSLGDRVEIRVRDNGTGITPEVKEKIFNPFFTTKPAGEGTGLGLSICHDIIVKQHGGSIEVDTRPGEFTEIRVTLPRVAASLS
ncbi:MAG TPA: GAF domain-containing protein, partial [Pseudolabrys sp.]|nr:GAF domain-containing protein [Pseudolabrys sp.]